MTAEEFSNEFDTLVSSYQNSLPPGFSLNPLSFDEYEKSIYLTKAQEEVIQGLYTGKILGDSFEDTELIRRYLANLIKTEVIPCTEGTGGLTSNSVFAILPPDLWFITYEAAVLSSNIACINNKLILVIPITQDEFHRIKGNPFRKLNSRRALRLDIGNSKVELISDEKIKVYLVRYMSRPKPIILLDLPEGLTINEDHTKTENIKLNPEVCRMILETAVNMAIKSRVLSTGK